MKLKELFTLLGYSPHAGQQAFHDSDARFKLLVAGARFGKSLAASRDNLPETLGGATDGWLVGPTFNLSGPELDYLLTDMQRLGQEATVAARPPSLGAGWGAIVESRTAKMPQTLLGREIDWAILCEAAHVARDAFERYLRARLTSRSGRLTFATSPRGRNWIHAVFQHGPGWDTFQHATWENPHVDPAEIEQARASLPAETFDEQYGGQFTTAAGSVYREFQPALHVAKLATPAGAIIFKAIDLGYTSPFACLWAALDHEDRLLVLREHYQHYTAVPTHAETIHAIDAEFKDKGCTIGPAWADTAAAGERRILADCGVRTYGADKEVCGGIEAVRARLLAAADGKPRLLIDPGCVNLLREIEAYQWQESSTGQRVPLKRDDHALDALRYMCTALARKADWKPGGMLW